MCIRDRSSISGAIKEVENTYGITAFVRDSKGVRLTRNGEELLIEFKWILNRLDYLDEKFNGSKNRPLGLSVSSQHHICGMNSFVSIINSLNTGAEPYHCGFHECRTSEVMDRVERGLDDLGIVFVTEYSKGQMMQELRNRSIDVYKRQYLHGRQRLSQHEAGGTEKAHCHGSPAGKPFFRDHP